MELPDQPTNAIRVIDAITKEKETYLAFIYDGVFCTFETERTIGVSVGDTVLNIWELK